MSDRHTPVLVGTGIVTQRVDDPAAAAEPLTLMVNAANEALGEAPELRDRIGMVAVPVGRWRYGNPGRLIAEALDLSAPRTISALPGISQQTLISDAAAAIASGEVGAALIVGGEAGFRLRQAARTGVDLVDTESDRSDDATLRPEQEILPRHERDHLGPMPVGYYALIDSAWRHTMGLSVAERSAQIDAQYAAMSSIAAGNEHAWHREERSPSAIGAATRLAAPYGRHHVSDWSVDQASALLLCSDELASTIGVDRSRRIYPQVFVEANDTVPVVTRRDMHRGVGIELAAEAALDAAGCTASELDLVELYSCFPSAVAIHAMAFGLDPADPNSFTGAMPFAGGPFNNFVLHTTAQLARRLRNKSGRGLVTTVSGLLTKHGVAIWGTEPSDAGHRLVDVTAQTAAATAHAVVNAGVSGDGTAVAATVLSSRTEPDKAVAVVDFPDGTRTLASSTDVVTCEAVRHHGLCGREVSVNSGSLKIGEN